MGVCVFFFKQTVKQLLVGAFYEPCVMHVDVFFIFQIIQTFTLLKCRVVNISFPFILSQSQCNCEWRVSSFYLPIPVSGFT